MKPCINPRCASGWILAALGSLVLAGPAAAVRLDIGIGIPIGQTGISTGASYRLGGWNDRFGSYIFVDAGRYINRRSNRKERERHRAEDARSGAELSRVDLLVSPGDALVLLNGRRIDADGRDTLRLPTGLHRLEFLRPGYRSEVAELRVEPGIRYRVERKLARLQKGETPDPRLENPGVIVPLEEACRPAAPGEARP